MTFRLGGVGDASDLAILLDIASRRLAAWYWGTMAAPGQSWVEPGRDRIHSLTTRASHFSNWHAALHGGETLGGFFGLP